MVYRLRPATIHDLEAMMIIGHEGLRPHVEAYRVWDQEVEEEGFRKHFEPSKICIIQTDGNDVGYIKKEDKGDHVFIDGIYLHRDVRSKGIGTQLLRDLIQTGKPLKLRVYKSNPALNLYKRLGFIEASDDDQQVTMETKSDRQHQADE